MRGALTRFVQEVRTAGLPVSVAEGIDALRAATVAGVERESLREALAAALVKDEADREEFDAVFDRFFAPGTEAGAKTRRRTAVGGLGEATKRRTSEGEGSSPHDRRERAGAPAMERATKPAERRGDVERRAHGKRLLAKPFHDLEPFEAEELSLLAEELARRFRGRLRRRLRPSRRRGRLDFRRTLRRSIARGGAPIDLELRRRRPRRIDVVALCDVSGSVRHATDFFAAILAPCQDLLASLRVFVFVDRAVEATIEAGRIVPDAPLDVHAFSDLGRTLVLLDRALAPSVGRNTLLLVLGDARNNRRPPRADALARLRSRARSLWWLVPEARGRWGRGDSAIEAYRPHCDELLECANAAGLVAALDRLAR